MLKHRLTREVVILTGIKLVLLALLYVCFFSPSHRQVIDPVRLFSNVPPPASASLLLTRHGE